MHEGAKREAGNPVSETYYEDLPNLSSNPLKDVSIDNRGVLIPQHSDRDLIFPLMNGAIVDWMIISCCFFHNSIR